jgi:hypothetical protein
MEAVFALCAFTPSATGAPFGDARAGGVTRLVSPSRALLVLAAAILTLGAAGAARPPT